TRALELERLEIEPEHAIRIARADRDADARDAIGPRRHEPYRLAAGMAAGPGRPVAAGDGETDVTGRGPGGQRPRMVVHLDHRVVRVVAVLHDAAAVAEAELVIEAQPDRLAPEAAMGGDVGREEADVEMRLEQAHR